MYKPQHSVRKRNKRLIILLSVLALTLTVVVGTTLAFLFTQTDPLENKFQPTKVTCSIEESFDGKVKKDVKITNTGTTDAYIRTSVVVTWKNSDGSIAAEKPIEGTDYEIDYAENTGWIKGADGYWYYTNPVAPGASTGDLIKQCTQKVEKDGCRLEVEILASAIQSEPTEAVTEAWGVTVASDGTISKGA